MGRYYSTYAKQIKQAGTPTFARGGIKAREKALACTVLCDYRYTPDVYIIILSCLRTQRYQQFSGGGGGMLQP